MMLKIQLYITGINYTLNRKQLFSIIKYHNLKKNDCIFNQINAALLSLRDFFQKYYYILPPLNSFEQ